MRRLLVAIALSCMAVLAFTRVAVSVEAVDAPPAQMADVDGEGVASCDGSEVDDDLVEQASNGSPAAEPVRTRPGWRAIPIAIEISTRLERPPKFTA